jgi:cell division transport system permease protein
MRAKIGKSSSVYAIISNTIVLVLIGLFSLLYFHSNSISNLLKEKINIIVELNDSASVQKAELISSISKLEGVNKSSVKFVGKEEAPKILNIDANLIQNEKNPFKDIITFNVASNYFNNENLSKIKERIKSNVGVLDVFYENVEIDNIKNNLHNVSYLILLLSLVFVFLAIIIMYNTINLGLYADRWEIKTMEIIGARDNFIRQPYIKIAGNIALRSFLFATIILLVLVGFIGYNFSLFNVINIGFIILSIIIILIISLMICIGSTVSIVNKYLIKQSHELHV